MARLNLNDFATLSNTPAIVALLNANFALIETEFEKPLYRDGEATNTMEANLDMNSNRILNLPEPVADTEPVRKGEFDDLNDEFDDLETDVNNSIAALQNLVDDLNDNIDFIETNVAAAAASAAAAQAAEVAAEAAQAAAEAAAADAEDMDFIELNDVPASYTGHGNKAVQVNSAATALEFSSTLSLTSGFPTFDLGSTDFGGLTITNAHAGAGGSWLYLQSTSASPAISDIVAGITLSGRDLGGGNNNYGAIIGKIADPTAGAEVGQVLFEVLVGGGTLQALTLGATCADGTYGHIFNVGSQNFNTLQIQSDSAAATSTPGLLLYKNSSTPEDADNLGSIFFMGNDSGGTPTIFASMAATAADVTNTTEDGRLDFYLTRGGVEESLLIFTLDAQAVTALDGYNDTARFNLGDGAFPALILESSSNFADGSALVLYQNSASPAADDKIGLISGYGKDSAGNVTGYGDIEFRIVSATNGSESSQIRLATLVGGTYTPSLAVVATDANHGSIRVGDLLESALGLDGATGSIQSVVSDNTSTWGMALANFGANNSGYQIAGAKSRNATPGSHTVVQSGDHALELYGYGSDGDEFHPLGLITISSGGTPGNNDMPGRLEFYTTPDGSTTLSHRWSITSAGHLVPAADITYDIGTSTVGINDLHLGTGSVINIDNGATTITDVDADGQVHWGGTNTLVVNVPMLNLAQVHYTWTTDHIFLNGNARNFPGFNWTCQAYSSTSAVLDWATITGTTNPATITLQNILSHNLVALTVATLPAAAAGKMCYVTDSNTAVWGATVAGGGANKVLVWYNGTNWTVFGA